MNTINPCAGIAIAVLVAACQSGSPASKFSEPKGTEVQVGAAALEVPTGWETTLTDPSGTRQVWAPAVNDDKESIAVRVVARPSGTVADDLLEDALDAQASLRDVQVAQERRITTATGLPAIWMEVSFVPPNARETYQRTHVTVVGERHIVHLLYTARTPDRAQAAIHLAVNSVREDG